MKPFVKWAGGKRQILARINEFIEGSLECEGIEKDRLRYIEPFLGGGAVLFDLLPNNAVVNDLNSDLINAYKVIKSDKVYELIDLLEKHQDEYKNEDRDELYYSIRSKDRTSEWNEMTDVEKAARMIFLNRTCYNGLYRVNSFGQFNTPMGRYRNPLICDKENLLEIHEYLKNHRIKIMNGSYEQCIKEAQPGDVIYVDPPYDYEDDDGFTKYQMQGFTFEDFKKLKEACDEALKKGAYVIVSNNATQRVVELFQQDARYKIYGYETNKFQTLRNINCKGENRKTGYEVIFWGIPTSIPVPQANDLNKIINLVLAENPEIYKDKKAIQTLLNLTTERQVSYYLAALKWFGYINNVPELTDKAKELRNDSSALIKDMKERIKNDDFMKYICEHNLENIDDIAVYLKNRYKVLSDTTARRRASTYKAWLKFAYSSLRESF